MPVAGESFLIGTTKLLFTLLLVRADVGGGNIYRFCFVKSPKKANYFFDSSNRW